LVSVATNKCAKVTPGGQIDGIIRSAGLALSTREIARNRRLEILSANSEQFVDGLVDTVFGERDVLESSSQGIVATDGGVVDSQR